MSFSAIVPTALMIDANAELEALGFGPGNFSVPAFAGANPSHGMFHSWDDPAFEAAVSSLPNVTIERGAVTPPDQVSVLAQSVGAGWVQSARPLVGVVTPGLYVDADDVFWWVIQQYDTAIWPDPTVIPALIVPARMPGEVTTWIQPLNQFTAYALLNAFTGEPDYVEHAGHVWYVEQADGAGWNIWEPGVFGWRKDNAGRRRKNK